MSKKILVTGGTGFIGSHTILALLKKGYEVVAYDSLINSSLKSLERVKEILKKDKPHEDIKLKFIKGDMRDTNLLQNIFEKSRKMDKEISAVIHFAGLKSVTNSIINPIDYWDVNVNGTINLVKVMNTFKCSNFVFSSSAMVYGYSTGEPLKEDFSIDPINPYGMTKAVNEKFLENLFSDLSQEWSICNLRYFNPIGAHESGKIGEFPLGVSKNIFPLINQVGLKIEKKLKVFGCDWGTIDGTCVRDYINIMDLSEGHILALEYITKKKPIYLNLNLGTGKGVSVLNLISAFEEANNVRIPYDFSDRREGDIPVLVADNSKAKEILNWHPKRNLLDSCRDGWKWFKNNPRGYY